MHLHDSHDNYDGYDGNDGYNNHDGQKSHESYGAMTITIVTRAMAVFKSCWLHKVSKLEKSAHLEYIAEVDTTRVYLIG